MTCLLHPGSPTVVYLISEDEAVETCRECDTEFALFDLGYYTEDAA